jgi:hypothetical protein
MPHNTEYVLEDRSATTLVSILVDGISYLGKTKKYYEDKGYVVVAEKEGSEILHDNDEALYIKDWKEISESSYWRALEELPPLRHRSVQKIEFFFCSEAYANNIHSCYCNIGKKYYTANRRVTTSYEDMLIELKGQGYVK